MFFSETLPANSGFQEAEGAGQSRGATKVQLIQRKIEGEGEFSVLLDDPIYSDADEDTASEDCIRRTEDFRNFQWINGRVHVYLHSGILHC